MTSAMTYAEAFLNSLSCAMEADNRVTLLGRPFSLGPTRPLSDALKKQFPEPGRQAADV